MFDVFRDYPDLVCSLHIQGKQKSDVSVHLSSIIELFSTIPILIGLSCFTQISDKVISLPGTVKGRLLFVATVLRMRSAFPFLNHTCHPQGKPDMHPVDLIRDSSMWYAKNLSLTACQMPL